MAGFFNKVRNRMLGNLDAKSVQNSKNSSDKKNPSVMTFEMTEEIANIDESLITSENNVKKHIKRVTRGVHTFFVLPAGTPVTIRNDTYRTSVDGTLKDDIEYPLTTNVYTIILDNGKLYRNGGQLIVR